jgi:hypothetical protein
VADLFAMKTMLGVEAAPELTAGPNQNAKVLAQHALELERASGADASTSIFAWARLTLDYPTATLAVRALYRDTGARRILGALCSEYLDFTAGSETDQTLLRSVQGMFADDDAGD